jgi:hypothetical protein
LLMILPPRGVCDFISTNACCVHRNTAVRLMSRPSATARR